ncbi:MAG: heavy metal-associated domain-containing protein [Acholeplasma sp.]|jgi:copper chaperone CopZ|nr:heavy metal-associated domain-containing protein [Acholeplasma sp.]
MSFETRIKVDGIRCGGCLNRINQELYRLDLKHFSFDASTSIIKFEYDEDRQYYVKVLTAIEQMGYKVKMINIVEK